MQGGVSQGNNQVKSESDYFNWLNSKFARQYNQYLQIKKDTDVVGRPDLWVGKLPRRLSEARLVLDLSGARTFKARVRLLMQAPTCSWIFKIKYLIYISFPFIGVFMKCMQNK